MAAGLAPYLDKPFAFFGHSMGALIGYELTRHLRRHRRPAARSPLRLGPRGAASARPEPAAARAAARRNSLDKLRELNGTPEEVLRHPELRELLIPILRADFEVCETYVYPAEPPLDCPISAFSGLGDDYVNREELEAWREQTTGRASASGCFLATTSI